MRLVRVNRTVGDKTVVADGLAAGDRIVTDGQLRLANGMRVSVQRDAPSSTPKAQSVPVAERAP
jgi:multidrug efflux system membrane fusion protein